MPPPEPKPYHGRQLPIALAEAAAVLAAIVGQDLDEGNDGCFRIARRVAKDRILSTVDPEARHGHKTAAQCLNDWSLMRAELSARIKRADA